MAVSMRAAAPVKAVRANKARRNAVVCKAQKVELPSVAAAAVVAGALMSSSASALTYDELQGLTYLQVKGTGIANTCPTLAAPASPTELKPGKYQLQKFCIEPTEFTVKEESNFKGGVSEYVKTKLMTRLTYTLDEMSGTLTVGSDGSVELKEEDGIDYAAVTVQLPGGERVPFLFTVKELAAKGTLDSFSGDFVVPSYRGATFLDPKGRGAATGYDNAVALPARADDEELAKENNKSMKALRGSAVLTVGGIDPVTGEISGLFESIQPSDTDMGAKVPKDIKIRGVWYGQLSN